MWIKHSNSAYWNGAHKCLTYCAYKAWKIHIFSFFPVNRLRCMHGNINFNLCPKRRKIQRIFGKKNTTRTQSPVEMWNGAKRKRARAFYMRELVCALHTIRREYRFSYMRWWQWRRVHLCDSSVIFLSLYHSYGPTCAHLLLSIH